MCYLVPLIELSVSHTSVLTILAITVERYYAICLPLQVRFIMHTTYIAVGYKTTSKGPQNIALTCSWFC